MLLEGFTRTEIKTSGARIVTVHGGSGPPVLLLHGMCLDHPNVVSRAAILDIIPQHHLLNHVTRDWGRFSWHWFFMIQPYDFPERLMNAEPEFFIRKKLAKTKQGLSFFDEAA